MVQYQAADRVPPRWRPPALNQAAPLPPVAAVLCAGLLLEGPLVPMGASFSRDVLLEASSLQEGSVRGQDEPRREAWEAKVKQCRGGRTGPTL